MPVYPPDEATAILLAQKAESDDMECATSDSDAARGQRRLCTFHRYTLSFQLLQHPLPEFFVRKHFEAVYRTFYHRGMQRLQLPEISLGFTPGSLGVVIGTNHGLYHTQKQQAPSTRAIAQMSFGIVGEIIGQLIDVLEVPVFEQPQHFENEHRAVCATFIPRHRLHFVEHFVQPESREIGRNGKFGPP